VIIPVKSWPVAAAEPVGSVYRDHNTLSGGMKVNTETSIRTRFSNKIFKDNEVSRDLIERCIELAVCAPNHRMTEPWRFRVITGEGRNRLAENVAQQMAGTSEASTSAINSADANRVMQKLGSAPCIIVVYSMPGDNAVITRENIAATSAAVQNLLLGAHHLGLGTIWRTASYFEGDHVKAFLQVPQESDFVAAVYMGYTDQQPVPRKRTAGVGWTVWI